MNRIFYAATVGLVGLTLAACEDDATEIEIRTPAAEEEVVVEKEVEVEREPVIDEDTTDAIEDGADEVAEETGEAINDIEAAAEDAMVDTDGDGIADEIDTDDGDGIPDDEDPDFRDN
jgi:hypothetical protein